MPKILQLSAHVADLIAAGEVVERPASVVKELLENSIDAGAKNVTVEIQNGGMTLIRVTDDGCGIAAEDAATAFLRHATSKIRSKEDLQAIGTLGFRGEALAATAAVSKIDLLTRTATAEEGVRLHLEAGKVLINEPAGCPAGTTIIVRDLFYNTPARMKFMKQDSVEGSAVFSVVQKQALAHPEISVRFIKDGTEQLHTPADGDLYAAIYSVLGRQTAKDMLPVSGGWERLKLTGFVSHPMATRNSRSQQIFFVNRRYVRSKTLTAALEEAYRNQMMVGRFPSCVLNIEIPLSLVDVNVHPAKTEVKFLNEREAFDAVHYGVLGALNRASGKVEMKLKPPAEQQASAAVKQDSKPMHFGKEPKKDTGNVVPKKDFYRTMDVTQYKTFLSVKDDFKKTVQQEAPQRTNTGNKTVAEKLCEGIALPSTSSKTETTAKDRIAHPNTMPTDVTNNEKEIEQNRTETVSGQTAEQMQFPIKTEEYRIVGEVLDTYIVVEQNETVQFIDKHAAHERILFEKLKKQSQEAMGQSLITPLLCEMDKEEAAILLQNREMLLSLGYDIDDAADGTLLLRQIPAEFDEEDAQAGLAELVECLKQGGQKSVAAQREELLHSIACKAAIKAGQHTDATSRAALVKEVLLRDDLKYCPHGRPICAVLTKKQLEKQFKRIQ